MAQVISGEILQLCPSDVRFVGRKLQFRRSLRNDIDDHQLRTVVKSRYARRFPRQTAADDHACIAAHIHAARVFGENALIRRVYAAQAITEILNDQLLYTISYYDAYESFYHGFLLALLSTCADWQVASNMETGRGRCDILVQRRDRKLGFVVEVKQVRDPDQLNAACEAAMRQIEEKDYTAVLRRYRVKQMLKYGIAFCDKESAVRAGSARCQ